MTHEEIRLQVDAYLDGELAPNDARALESHLQTCPDCARFRDTRTALGAAIRREIPEFRAPDELRSRIRARLQSAAGIPEIRPEQPGQRWRWLALAASVALAALAGWGLGREGAANAALQEQLLASHVRSLMPGHLTDVVSSDRHTVKPWFNGRLDYSPPVHDFAGRGYPLVGARLDYVGGRPVAALVYQRRNHFINVYLWPSGRGTAELPSLTRQGYHLLQWTADGYSYWIVSDLGAAELGEFARLLRAGGAAG